jgi:hypothetical protein
MSLLIRSFKPHENMRIGNFSQQNMLINFQSDDGVEKSTAVLLVKVSYQEDPSASFEIYPPDKLATIKNLATNQAMTIYNYNQPNAVERFGYVNWTLSQQDPWRIWAYQDNTKIFTQTDNGAITLIQTLNTYQKINSYTPVLNEQIFSNKPIQCGYSTQPVLSFYSHVRGKVFLIRNRGNGGFCYAYSLHDNTTIEFQSRLTQNPQIISVSTKHTQTQLGLNLIGVNDFGTVKCDKDICLYIGGGGNDNELVYEAHREMILGLDSNARLLIWDSANPTTTPTVNFTVQYSDLSTNTNVVGHNANVYTLQSRANYHLAFTRVILDPATPSTIYIAGVCWGDGGGNDMTTSINPNYLSNKIAMDDSIPTTGNEAYVLYAIQYTNATDDLVYKSDINLGFFPSDPLIENTVSQAPTTTNIQEDGVKLLTYYIGQYQFQKKEYKSDHSTTLFLPVVNIFGDKEHQIPGNVPALQNITPNASTYPINSKQALSLNASALSYNIGTAETVYDTEKFGITALTIFKRNGTQYNRAWIKFCSHGGKQNAYFSISRYSSTNYICIQFRGTTYFGNDEMIAFNFSDLQNSNTHLIYGAVKEISDENFEFHMELWAFTTSGTSQIVDTKIFTKNIAYITNPSFNESNLYIGIDNSDEQENDFSSITIAETRHYKGNFNTNDKDNLIQNIINYWET